MRYTRRMEEFRTGYGRDWLDFAITLVDRYGHDPRDLVADPGSAARVADGVEPGPRRSGDR